MINAAPKLSVREVNSERGNYFAPTRHLPAIVDGQFRNGHPDDADIPHHALGIGCRQGSRVRAQCESICFPELLVL